MKRSILLGLLWLAICASSATSQPIADPAERLESSRRHHEWVEIDAPDGRKVNTFVVYPESDHPATTVIVIHENRGLADWVRGVADQLAEAGYLALAPDLLSGAAPGRGGTAEFSSQDAATQGVLPSATGGNGGDSVLPNAGY